MDPSTQPTIQAPVPQPTQSPTPPPQKPVDALSANSKNVKKFQLYQRFRGVYFLLIIGVPLVLGVIAFTIYQKTVHPTSTLSEAPLESIAQNNSTPAQAPSTSAPTTGSTGASGSSSSGGSSRGSSTTKTSTEMPEGVIVAINSIEANGIKNNPYVNIDTSNVPEGTVIKVDRKSWTQFGPDQIAVNGTVTVYGQSRQGSLTFGKVNGTWKVINYTVVS